MCSEASRLAQRKYNASPQGKETRRKWKEKKKQERYLPEALSSTVDGYNINGDQITTPSGNQFSFNLRSKARQLTPAEEKRLKSQIKFDDPVVIDNRAIIPQSVYNKAIDQLQQQSKNYQANMDKNVKGYDELSKAISHYENVRKQEKNAFEQGYSKFDKPKGTPTTKDISELKKKYPRAAAYMVAESYAYSSHADKSEAGHEAMEKIRHGENHNKVIKSMKEKFGNAVKNKGWTD